VRGESASLAQREGRMALLHWCFSRAARHI
jgi:hypothetical protein